MSDLRIAVATRRGIIHPVDGVSFSLRRGETLGLVGESGCGKTMTCLTLLRLLPASLAKTTGGRVVFEGVDLLRVSDTDMRAVRGRKISMILQDSLTSLNPTLTIGHQVAEAIRLHRPVRGTSLRERVVDALGRVRISDAASHLSDYPHRLSGGMRQRVAGTIALAGGPSLLIADEPTTALDVTVQAQYLALLKELQAQTQMGIIIVTHDFGVVARMCDHVAVMYAGRIVESGATREIFNNPQHPYTKALLACLPKLSEHDGDLVSIDGQPPDPGALPEGCRFMPRCGAASERCRVYPAERVIGARHRVCCWHADKQAQGE